MEPIHNIRNQLETFEAQRHYRIWNERAVPTKMDLITLKEQAERCRRLAKHADSFTEKRLLDLAAEYDARIAQLEPKPSPATRSLRNGET